ncbi:MAG: FtsX-like permease family protein [Paracoccaceae bacterium]
MRRGTVLGRARWTLAALASHWRRHPLQAAALVAGLVIATALWSGVQALNAEARASYDRAAEFLTAGAADRIEPLSGDTVPAARFAELRRAGFQVTPLLDGRIEIDGRGYRLLGVDALSLPDGPLLAAVAQSGDLARFLLAPWQTLAGPETRAALGLPAGAEPATGGGTLPPLQAVERLAPGLLVVDIAAAARILGRPEAVSYFLLDPNAARPTTPLDRVAPDLRRVPAETESEVSRLTGSFHLNLTAFGFLAFVVGLFIVHAAIGLAFEQRLGVIRTVRALGVPAGEVAAVLLAELLAVALLAGVLGMALGYLLAALLLPDVAATLRGLYGADVSGTLSLRPSWWLAGLGMSFAGALVAAGHTLWRAYAMPILASARREAWRAAQERAIRWQAALGALAFAVGLAALELGGGLIGGFAAMAGLLLGAALVLPLVLSGLLALAGRLTRSPIAAWAVADSRQQISGLSLALMALLLALAANIGVGTMVEGFRQTFTDWLDRRLAAEIYYDPAAAAKGPRIAAWLEGRPEVRAILPTRRTEAEVAGWPSDIVGRRDAPTYREEWPLLSALPEAWDRVAAGEAILVSEQLMRKARIRLGDRIELPAPSGPWSVTVVGVYPDYGNPRGQVHADLAAFDARFPGAPSGGTGIRVDAAAVDALILDMRAEFGLGPRELRDNRDLKALSQQIFDQTFTVTGMLRVLTLAVAGVALFASLVTLADLRLPQLAPLWAMGVRRRTLGLLELAKTALLALLTAVAAIPLGIGVAWLLVAVVNVEAFGWRLPLHLYPAQWAALVALTLGVAVLAAALPAFRLARMAPARLAKLFSEDR